MGVCACSVGVYSVQGRKEMLTLLLTVFVFVFSVAMMWVYYAFVEWLMTR